MSQTYVNVLVLFSSKPFPTETNLDLAKIATGLGLAVVENPTELYKLAAKQIGWQEDMTERPEFALTPIPEGTSEEDQARIEEVNVEKIGKRQVAENPQWFLEDSLAASVLALIRDEKKEDIPPRQAQAFNKIFDQQFDIA